MKDELIEKIGAQLGKLPIDDEPRALYLMAEIRKLFERDTALEVEFSALTFYCDWALHTTLDRRAARELLTQLYPILMLEDGNDEAQAEANRLLALNVFREQLHKLISQHHLRPDLCTNDDQWNSFLGAYARIVENCPLILTNPPSPAKALGIIPVAVESLTVEADTRSGALSNERPFPMKWHVEYRPTIAGGRRASGTLLMSNSGLSVRTFSF